MATASAYDHVQRGSLHWFLHFLVLPMMAVGLVLETGLEALPWVMAGIFELLAFSFQRLRVRDKGENLSIAFGPLPLARKKVPYGNMLSATAGRTSLIQGWGIHWLPFKGWTWNIKGRGCVDIKLASGGTLTVGTDDPQGLEAFLQSRIAA